METITSRKNQIIMQFRALAADRACRMQSGEFVCDGLTTLGEALDKGAQVRTVLWAQAPTLALPDGVRQYRVPRELLEYASPLKNSPGPVFTAAIPALSVPASPERVIVLEGVQDPGNVGTVVRTASAFGLDAVVLLGGCADVYHPKTVRSAMGAVFRQPVIQTDLEGLRALLTRWGLPLYGAALSDSACDLRTLPMARAAAAVGSEGRGLSQALLAACDRQVIIPMQPWSESLNAAVAACVLMWEMVR